MKNSVVNHLVKLVTFSCGHNRVGRVGMMVGANKVLDLTAAGKYHGSLPTRGVDMVHLIENQSSETISILKSLLEKDEFLESDLRPLESINLLPPINLPRRNVICVGKNYMDHVAEVAAVHAAKAAANGEAGATPPPLELPKYAQFFTKAPQTVVPHGANVESHSNITKILDYEAELAVVIGKKGRDISSADAMKYVFGYTIANDITSRDLQKKHNQWFKGKSLDTTCPLGPCIVPASQLDASDLAIKMWINGEKRQDSRTSNMIFKVSDIIEQLSAGFTLYPGDVILTGTPHGVGFAMKPPQVLKAGDLMEVEIEHIGRLVNKVV
jgi:2-keto-4-pentenoate hydratase/2-oxohepta-3-ene-1,7-dioic acid hydratase in catechol pathway